MMKILSAFTVASTLLSLSLPTTALAQVSDSLCSMTTSSGTTINLSSLCSGSNQPSQLQSGLYLQGVTTKLKKDYSRYKRIISGDVVNNSGDTHLVAKLEYQLYQLKSGQLVRSESGSESLATGYGIRPGESNTFEFESPGNFYVIVLKLKSDSFSGDPVCFANTLEKEDYCRQLTREVRKL